MCDVPVHDNSPSFDVSKDQFEDLSESNEEFSSTDDDSFSIDKIDYVEASPPDSELVSSEVMKIVIPKVGGIDADILLTIKDDILCEKLLNVKERPKKGQNRIKTGQKRKAWRRQEKSKAVTVDKERKTEENTKRKARIANSYKVLLKKEEKKEFSNAYPSKKNPENQGSRALY
nr:hypothetical protein [Tanacetum cinerariifolium]